MTMQTMLTTKDNPFNVFTEYDQWVQFDQQQGYYTPQYLARISNVDDSLSDAEIEYEIDRAITEILEYDILGIYELAVE
jgi:hypothetical protein